MVSFADALFVETDGTVPIGDAHFETLWPAAMGVSPDT